MERRAIRWELNGSCDGVDVDMVEEGDDEECGDELDPVVVGAAVDGCRGSGGTTIVIARDDDDESGGRDEREEEEGGRERDIDCPRVLFDDGDVITQAVFESLGKLCGVGERKSMKVKGSVISSREKTYRPSECVRRRQRLVFSRQSNEEPQIPSYQTRVGGERKQGRKGDAQRGRQKATRKWKEWARAR